MGVYSKRMRILFMTVMVFSVFISAFGQTKNRSPYQLYNSKGKKVSYRKMLKKLHKSDIILFGELHNNSIAHWMELSLVKDLHPLRPLVIGTEMIEMDNQAHINDYLAGRIDQDGLDTVSKLATNYKMDYKAILDFAKANKLAFVTSNIPRQFASQVYHGGFEALERLSEKEKAWVAPLPIDYDPNLPGYVKMLDMMPGHGGENFPKAQAIKDATMAHFILKNYKPGNLFFHFNGAYHSDNYEGILWYLQRQKPELNYVTISTVEQKDITKLDAEHRGVADFILCVDEDVVKSY